MRPPRPNPIRRRPLHLLPGLLLLLVLVSCGVPLDDHPREITLSTSTTTEVTTTTGPSSRGDRAEIYFVDENGALRSDEVSLERASIPGALSELLSADPPSGLKSRIPSGTRLLEVRTQEDRVIVDLSSEMHDIESPLDRVAYAQLTFTVLAFPDIREVTFEIDGKSVDAPTDDGNRQVVTAGDYLYPLRPR